MRKENSDQNNSSYEELDQRSFVEIMAKPKSKEVGEVEELINDHNSPVDEFVHPLIHSVDVKNHPEMEAIPMCYKTSRGILKKYKKLTQQNK